MSTLSYRFNARLYHNNARSQNAPMLPNHYLDVHELRKTFDIVRLIDFKPRHQVGKCEYQYIRQENNKSADLDLRTPVTVERHEGDIFCVWVDKKLASC